MTTIRISIVLVFAAISLSADNGPAWRGPLGTGVCLEKKLPTEWSATRNVKWKVALPERGNSSPVVWGGKVFVTQAIEKEGRRTLLCLDRRDGKVLWQKGVIFKDKEVT